MTLINIKDKLPPTAVAWKIQVPRGKTLFQKKTVRDEAKGCRLTNEKPLFFYFGNVKIVATITMIASRGGAAKRWQHVALRTPPFPHIKRAIDTKLLSINRCKTDLKDYPSFIFPVLRNCLVWPHSFSGQLSDSFFLFTVQRGGKNSFEWFQAI